MKYNQLTKELKNEAFKIIKDFEIEKCEMEGIEPRVTNKDVLTLMEENDYNFKVEKDKYGRTFLHIE